MVIKYLKITRFLSLTLLLVLVFSLVTRVVASADDASLYNQTEWYTGTLTSQCASGSAGDSVTTSATGGLSGYGSASMTASLPKSVDQITHTSSTSTNTTDVNAKIFYQYFIGKGLSPNVVAGLMGNVTGESHFRADNGSEHYYTTGWPTGGYGLTQWTGNKVGDRRYLLVKAMNAAGIGNLYNQQWGEHPDRGYTPPDQAGILLGFELDYLWYELSGPYDYVLNGMKKAATYQEATKVFMDRYERPGSDSSLPGRIDAATKWLNKFAGVEGLSGSSGSTSCTGATTPPSTGTFIYYSQTNPKWADHPFRGDTISGSGCGATSYAMAVANLMGRTDVTPPVIADWSKPFWSEFGYVGQVLADHGVAKYGLQEKHLGTNMSEIIASLKAGKYVIMGGKGSKPFSDVGHIVLAHGLTAEGKLIIADPVRNNATAEYTPSEVQSAGLNYAVALWK